MATWRNILDLPGITYGFTYDGGNPSFSISGGRFQFDNAGGFHAPWYYAELSSSNIVDLVTTPCNMRLTLAWELVSPSDEYFRIDCGGDTVPADPNSAGDTGELTASGTSDGGNPAGSGYDTSGPVLQMRMLIEVDGDPLETDIWTDFANSYESDLGLHKPRSLIEHPGTPGQNYNPPSFDCYPAPPGPPTDPPGGGGGSGPPGGGGCYNQPIYTPIMSCGGYPPDDPRATFPCTLTYIITGYIEVCP